MYWKLIVLLKGADEIYIHKDYFKIRGNSFFKTLYNMERDFYRRGC